MSLEKATLNWSAKQINTMVKKGTIDFGHIIQRSYCWERSRKSALVESLFLGYPVPPIYAKRTVDNSKTYYIMDGKQRLSTISDFIDDKFMLTEVTPIQYEDSNGETHTADISGKKFSELPTELQDEFKTVMLTITYFDNLTENEERELFKRLNAGKPLSSKNKMLASAEDAKNILDIGNHRMFKTMLTEKALDNKNQATIVMKTWMMLFKPLNEVTFETKPFGQVMETTVISDSEKAEISKIYDAAMNIYAVLDKKAAKNFFKEVHFVSMVPFIKRGIDEDIDIVLMADWIEDFFDTENSRYFDACHQSSAKNNAITIRNEELEASFDKFFTNDDENKEIDTETEEDNTNEEDDVSTKVMAIEAEHPDMNDLDAIDLI